MIEAEITRLEMREAGKKNYVVNFLSGVTGLLSHRRFWLIFSPVIIEDRGERGSTMQGCPRRKGFYRRTQ
jgi:hypothetical protein